MICKQCKGDGGYGTTCDACGGSGVLDETKTYIVGFSGGKDSVATWLYLTKELELPNVVCTFADTGHEWEGLSGYLEELRDEHGCPLVVIQPTLEDVRGELKPEKIRKRLDIPNTVPDKDFWDSPLDMERLAIIKRRFPSATARFCTNHLKLYPQRRWLKERYNPNEVIRVSGVRAEESPQRASRPVWLEEDPIFGCPLWLPIHKWTHDQVFGIHKKYGVPPNPLYKKGCSRVGCFPCIFAKKSEIRAVAEEYPEALINLREMEIRVSKTKQTGTSFFSKDKVPPKYRSQTCTNSGENYPTAEDVRKWALEELPGDENQGHLFTEDWTEDADQCRSQYGLCE